MQAEFKLSLLDNGVDFIREGIEALYGVENPPPRTYKYAILHVFSGTLLVLKERLRKEHDILIFKDVSRGKGPGSYTVDFEGVLSRLATAAGVTLDDSDRKLLSLIRAKRNELEHFEADLKIAEVNALIGKLVEFLERFMDEELNYKLIEKLSLNAQREVRELSGIAARARQRQADEWQRKVAAFENEIEERLEEILSSGRRFLDELPCPKCREQHVVEVEDDLAFCTACRTVHRLGACNRCGALAMAEGNGLCPDCGGGIVDDDF